VRKPREFQSLPGSMVTHTSDHSDFAGFSGKHVLVIGGGQSALESAALLHEAGAEVEVITRARHINWLQGWASKTLHHRLGKYTRRLLYAPTDVGPAGLSQLLARPHLVRLLPRPIQDKLRKRATRPAGARWLVNRLHDVPIRLGCEVVSVAQLGDQVRVRLSDTREITVDHVILGTGFHIDVSKYDFLPPMLMQQIDRVNGFPILGDGLETSIPGLHILGAPGVHCFGPLLQFVSGTHFASQSLMRSLHERGNRIGR
jgi:FAD-dependent urate hydroxylase